MAEPKVRRMTLPGEDEKRCGETKRRVPHHFWPPRLWCWLLWGCRRTVGPAGWEAGGEHPSPGPSHWHQHLGGRGEKGKKSWGKRQGLSQFVFHWFLASNPLGPFATILEEKIQGISHLTFSNAFWKRGKIVGNRGRIHWKKAMGWIGQGEEDNPFPSRSFHFWGYLWSS